MLGEGENRDQQKMLFSFVILRFIEHSITSIFWTFKCNNIYSSRETKEKNLEECMRLIMSLQSELHGLAALQWSICQDSLSRYVQKLHIPKLLIGTTKLCSTQNWWHPSIECACARLSLQLVLCSCRWLFLIQNHAFCFFL